MRRRARITTALAAMALIGGCQGGSTGGYRRSAAKPEPALSSADVVADGSGSGTVISKSPPPTVGIVERHPLFYKPREIYNNAGNNKVVKVAGAAIVGVPMGIAGELRQIVVGAPAKQATAY
jgi:hypothetical protein